jgi:hypothetical protein
MVGFHSAFGGFAGRQAKAFSPEKSIANKEKLRK